MKLLFFTIMIILITTFSYAEITTPERRNNEKIVWVANQYEREQEAIRLTEALNTFNNKEIKCLAINIYFEARSESIEGQAAVAWVTLNRRDVVGFRDTVCKVVYQRWKNPKGVYICQFSWYCDTQSDYPAEKEAYSIALVLATDIYYHVDSFEDPTKGATYYHATYVSPSWAKRLELVRLIGIHKFYKG